MAVPARVYIEVVDADSGAWCPACALPSGIRLHTVLRTPWGMEYRQFVVCDDCRRPIYEHPRRADDPSP